MDEMPKILGVELRDSERHFGDQCWEALTPLGTLYIERFGKSWKAHLALADFGDTVTTESLYGIRGDNFDGVELRLAAAVADRHLRQLLAAVVEPIAHSLDAIEMLPGEGIETAGSVTMCADLVRAFYAEEPSR